MTTRVIITSHALTDWNLNGLIQGHADVPLNRLGRVMALNLAETLEKETIDAVYSSDLIRAWQTAFPTARAKSLEITTDMGLREGRTFRQHLSPAYPALPFPTEIETKSMVLKRITRTLHRIAQNHDQQTILAVTHAGVLDIFINHITGGKKPGPFHGIRMALNRLEYTSGSWQCIELNRDFFLTPSKKEK